MSKGTDKAIVHDRTYICCHYCGTTHPVLHVTPPGWKQIEVVNIHGDSYGFVCHDCVKKWKETGDE